MPRSSNPVESKRIIMDLRILSRAYDCPHIVHSYGYLVTEGRRFSSRGCFEVGPADGVGFGSSTFHCGAGPVPIHQGMANEVMVCMEAMATCLDLLLKRTDNKPIPEPIVGKMSVSVVRALDYLKENHNVIHRDVKPSNILLDWNGVVKLCDFGISGFLIESRARSKLAGCPPYMAPERVRSTENTPYDIRSDVWSLGITLVELATGRFPYEGSDFQIITSILELPSPSLRVSDGFSEEFCALVDLCLRRDVEERPRYATILRHRFIVKNELADTDVSEWFGSIMT